MRLKNIDWPGTIAAVLIVLFLALFPLVNPCQSEDGTACTWRAAAQGNGSGWTFTDYYGITLYWHHN